MKGNELEFLFSYKENFKKQNSHYIRSNIKVCLQFAEKCISKILKVGSQSKINHVQYTKLEIYIQFWLPLEE